MSRYTERINLVETTSERRSKIKWKRRGRNEGGECYEIKEKEKGAVLTWDRLSVSTPSNSYGNSLYSSTVVTSFKRQSPICSSLRGKRRRRRRRRRSRTR
jgi:hypothetical protein